MPNKKTLGSSDLYVLAGEHSLMTKLRPEAIVQYHIVKDLEPPGCFFFGYKGAISLLRSNAAIIRNDQS